MAKKKSAAAEVGKSENKIRSVADLVKWVDTIDRDMLYRGLTNKARKVSASICRRLGVEVSKEEFIHASEGMVEQAKQRGYARDKVGELKDLQIMANLQHAGAATCLIDFTKNPMVALWFACQPSKDEDGKEADGKIIAVAGKPPKYEIIGSDNLGLPLKELLSKDHLWRWWPENLNSRIVAQHSEFIFGERAISPDEYIAAVIPADNKVAILRELVKYNISLEHLFPDFEGFARVNAHNRPYKPDYYASLAERAAQAGEYQRAIHWYDIAINDWNSSVWLNDRGNAKMLAGHLQDAIADFTAAIKLNQEYAKAYSNRGIANHKLGDYNSAIADFDRAIELNPQDAFAYYNRGNAKCDLGDYDNAIADYDRAIELNPQDATVYHNRGIAKGQLDDHKGAIADYDRAIKLNPQYADAYYNRGFAKETWCDKEGTKADYDYTDAIADYDRVIELNPQYTAAYVGRGNAKYELGNYDNAIADYDRAIELNPQDAVAYNNRGNAKYELGNYDNAIADYDRAIELNPQDATAYNNRGNAKRQSGEYKDEDAMADFDRAIELNPQYAIAYNSRGYAKETWRDEKGAEAAYNYADAIADYDKALKIAPQHARALHNRERAKKKLEDASNPKKK